MNYGLSREPKFSGSYKKTTNCNYPPNFEKKQHAIPGSYGALWGKWDVPRICITSIPQSFPFQLG